MDFIAEHIPIYGDLHKNVIKYLINDQDLIDCLAIDNWIVGSSLFVYTFAQEKKKKQLPVKDSSIYSVVLFSALKKVQNLFVRSGGLMSRDSCFNIED
ncbi:unnamed protein product [Mytilus edulis]|uniref:Uncharacterized protein n=1 Tax=Mytilus edulis TaxID=6550 RepID=A0A8S3UGX5_MYTED|nr:unnamed protein product [Mytilus edulis]